MTEEGSSLRKLVAIMLIVTQGLSLLPAQEMVLDISRGRQRLERYLDRASLERSAQSWESIAQAGMEAAMLEWESAHTYIMERDSELWHTLRDEALWTYALEKEKAYVTWAIRRLQAEVSHAENSALAAELREAAQAWRYQGSDGELTRQISLSEAGLARDSWEQTASEITDRYLQRWEDSRLLSYTELLARFAANALEGLDLTRIYAEAEEESRAYIKNEYARIAEAQGNALLRELLYDSGSLKKRVSGEAAGG